MRQMFICLLLIFSSSSSKAVVWRGTIIDADSRQPIQGAVITNMLSQFFVLTNELGQFDIQGAEGETISFTCPGYRSETHIILKGIEGIRLSFAMKLASKQLNEVVITQKYKTQYQRDSAERRVVHRSILNQKRSSLASPVSFAAERLSRSGRNEHNFRKNYYKLEQDQYNDTRYTPELVASLTSLGGDTLAHFMNIYPMPYNYARVATALELKMWVRYQYKDFLRNTDSLRKLVLPY